MVFKNWEDSVAAVGQAVCCPFPFQHRQVWTLTSLHVSRLDFLKSILHMDTEVIFPVFLSAHLSWKFGDQGLGSGIQWYWLIFRLHQFIVVILDAPPLLKSQFLPSVMWIIIVYKLELAMVAHSCNSSLLEGEEAEIFPLPSPTWDT